LQRCGRRSLDANCDDATVAAINSNMSTSTPDRLIDNLEMKPFTLNFIDRIDSDPDPCRNPTSWLSMGIGAIRA
jgi:hypothetical protein